MAKEGPQGWQLRNGAEKLKEEGVQVREVPGKECRG